MLPLVSITPVSVIIKYICEYTRFAVSQLYVQGYVSIANHPGKKFTGKGQYLCLKWMESTTSSTVKICVLVEDVSRA